MSSRFDSHGSLSSSVEPRDAARIAPLPSRVENDQILAKYGFDRDTVMLWNFDIDFNVTPVQDGTP